MAVKDIQAKLDESTKYKCEKDWENAIKSVYKIMNPFYEFMRYATKEEKEAAIADFSKHFRMDSYASPIFFSEMTVPASYVKAMQQKASEEFITKVNKLEEQMEELYGEVERMQR